LNAAVDDRLDTQLPACRDRILIEPGVLSDGPDWPGVYLLYTAELRNQCVGHPELE